MSHCFCFRVMSSSLVSSRISSRVRKCVSPFWCLVWDLNTESLRFTVNHIQMLTLSPCLISNRQDIIDSSGFVINRWHTNTSHIYRKSAKMNVRSAPTDKSDGERDRQNLVAFHTKNKLLTYLKKEWQMTHSGFKRQHVKLFNVLTLINLTRSQKRNKISSETYLHIVDYFG